MTFFFFSHRPGFSDFTLFTVIKWSYTTLYEPFFTRKTTIPEKNSLIRTFFYSVHPFARIRQHYFSKYWGSNAWAVPPPKIWGDRPPSPPRSPPLVASLFGRCARVPYTTSTRTKYCRWKYHTAWNLAHTTHRMLRLSK